MKAEEVTPADPKTSSIQDKTAEDQQGRKGSENWSRRGQLSLVAYNFEGAQSEIGGVLGMRHEKIKNKVVDLLNCQHKRCERCCEDCT